MAPACTPEQRPAHAADPDEDVGLDQDPEDKAADSAAGAAPAPAPKEVETLGAALKKTDLKEQPVDNGRSCTGGSLQPTNNRAALGLKNHRLVHDRTSNCVWCFRRGTSNTPQLVHRVFEGQKR